MMLSFWARNWQAGNQLRRKVPDTPFLRNWQSWEVRASTQPVTVLLQARFHLHNTFFFLEQLQQRVGRIV